MFLPPTYVAAGSATLHNNTTISLPSPSPGKPPYGESWSSLIGIITAIIGNVLISFALNMQRYAHIRLNREWEEKERRRKARGIACGPSQENIANHARKYHPPRHTDGTAENGVNGSDEGSNDAHESDALLPRHRRSPSDDSSIQIQSQAEENFKQKSYLKSPYWWLGIILMVMGEAGNFLAYGFAPASIVSPLGVVALISNCIIAPFMLKEPFRLRDGLGVLIAVSGAVTVVLSASDDNPKLGPDDIWDLITTWEFETYLGITIAVILGLMYASNRFGHKSILIDLGLVGLFGGYTALSTKGVASMLSYTLWRAITFPVTYLLAAILISTAIMQIKYINRALQRFDATQVIPTQFVLFTLSVILGSAILYRDFERTSSENAGKFVGGCAMTFAGVWLITSGRPRSSDDDGEDREPETPEAIHLVDGERYQDDVSVGSSTPRKPRTSPHRPLSPPIPTRRGSSRQTPVAESPISHESAAQPTPSGSFSEPFVNPWGDADAGGASLTSPSLRPVRTLVRQPTLSTPSTPALPIDPLVTPPSTTPVHEPSKPGLPATPARHLSDNALDITPVSGPTPRLRHRDAQAERLSVRASFTGPLLASPLSTGLNAMVADLKRAGSLRGLGHGFGGFLPHHGHKSAEIASTPAGAIDTEHGQEDRGDVLRTNSVGSPVGPSDSTARRGRSLSGTLGELWRGWRNGPDGAAAPAPVADSADGTPGADDEAR